MHVAIFFYIITCAIKILQTCTYIPVCQIFFYNTLSVCVPPCTNFPLYASSGNRLQLSAPAFRSEAQRGSLADSLHTPLPSGLPRLETSMLLPPELLTPQNCPIFCCRCLSFGPLLHTHVCTSACILFTFVCVCLCMSICARFV